MNVNNKKFNVFLCLLVVSLVGNACADYAIIWYGIAMTEKNAVSFGQDILSLFYVGQAVGVVLLAPTLATYIDRYSRRNSSILLDAGYAIILLAMLFVEQLGYFNPPIVFVFSAITAALAAIHRSSVANSVLKQLSVDLGLNNVVSKYMASHNITYLLGALISGFSYRVIGFHGCLLIGILTFLPMPFIYATLFNEKGNFSKHYSRNIFEDILAGIKYLKKDPILFYVGISIALLNIASAVFPAVVGLSFQQKYPGRMDYTSIALAIGILSATVLLKRMGEISKTFPLRQVIPISLLPALGALFLCLIFQQPLMYAVAFVSSCIGSGLRNVVGGSLRIKRIPQNMMARVSVANNAILYLGQIVGGFIVIPAINHSLYMGTLILIAAFVVAAAFSLATLSHNKLNLFLKEEPCAP